MLTQQDRTFLIIGTCCYIILFGIYFMISGDRSILDLFINIVLFIIWFVGSFIISNFISYN